MSSFSGQRIIIEEAVNGPQTATCALTNATLPFIVRVANMGKDVALQENSGLARGVNVRGGAITYPAVGEAHGLSCESLV